MPQVAWHADEGRYISVLECNRYMLDNEVACDVTFEVAPPGEKVELVRAHRYMLIARNPVFKTMFCSTLAEAGDKIVICDVLPGTLRKIIKYLYCETIDITGDDVLNIIYAAKKYLIHPITNSCFDFLHNNITTDTVCAILDCALFYDEKDLVKKCLRKIALKTREVLDSEAFTSLSKDAVRMIVESKILNISESELLDACIAWCKVECSRSEEEYKADCLKQYLGDAFYQFRISSLSVEFLHLRVIGSGMLSEEEEERLLKVGAAEQDRKTGAGVGLFPEEERQHVKSGECRCDLVTKCTGSVNNFNCDRLHHFTLSEDIILHGIEVVNGPRSCITGIHIAIIQDSKTVFQTGLSIMAARRATVYGTSIPLYLPKRVPLHEGEFTVKLHFRSVGGNASIGTCAPSREGIEVNGVRINPCYIDVFHIGTLLFSVI